MIIIDEKNEFNGDDDEDYEDIEEEDEEMSSDDEDVRLISAVNSSDNIIVKKTDCEADLNTFIGAYKNQSLLNTGTNASMDSYISKNLEKVTSIKKTPAITNVSANSPALKTYSIDLLQVETLDINKNVVSEVKCLPLMTLPTAESVLGEEEKCESHNKKQEDNTSVTCSSPSKKKKKKRKRYN